MASDVYFYQPLVRKCVWLENVAQEFTYRRKNVKNLEKRQTLFVREITLILAGMLASLIACVVFLVSVTLPSKAHAQQCAAVALNWVIPTTRVGGSPLPLTEIGGFTIVYWDVVDPANQFTIDVSVEEGQPVPNTYIVNQLACAAGTYNFGIATFDTNNVLSDFSPPISLIYTAAPATGDYIFANAPTNLTATEAQTEIIEPSQCDDLTVEVIKRVRCKKK